MSVFDGIKYRGRYLLRFRDPWHVGGPDVRTLLPHQLACRDEELAWLIRHHRARWGLVNGRIRGEGIPTALEGTYGGLNAYPPAQDLTAVTGGAANVAWWAASLYTPIPANSTMAPEAFRIAATGRVTTTASQTITPNANLGTAIGTGLAAGAAITIATITNALWFCLGDITIRATGTAGVAIGAFKFTCGTAAGATNTTTTQLLGGTATQTAIDFTAAQGLSFGATPSAAGVSVTPTQVHWMSWNVREEEEAAPDEHSLDGLKVHEHNPFGDPFSMGA